MTRAAKAPRMVDHAREIAELGDRWFLSVAAGVGRAGGWARHEADIVADSAVAAFGTTITVAKKLTALATGNLGPAREDDAPSPDEPALPEGSPLGFGLLHGEAPDRPDAPDAAALGIGRDARPGASPAGIVPLLQALGRTVSRHTQAGYASLQEDPRFWTLIQLVQTLGRPTLAARADDVADTKALEASSADSHLDRDCRRES
jgi:hypothetical protein